MVGTSCSTLLCLKWAALLARPFTQWGHQDLNGTWAILWASISCGGGRFKTLATLIVCPSSAFSSPLESPSPSLRLSPPLLELPVSSSLFRSLLPLLLLTTPFLMPPLSALLGLIVSMLFGVCLRMFSFLNPFSTFFWDPVPSAFKPAWWKPLQASHHRRRHRPSQIL